MKKRTKRNYVNNADLYAAMIEYKKAYNEAEDSGDPRPDVPHYIGECVWEIAKRLATKPNFSGYTFKDDMIMDGVENCIQYMHNFNPDKTSNPFAYFTQIIYYAFLRRIAKEKKQMYIRYKSSHEMISLGGTYAGGEEINMHLNTNADYINDFISDYEEKMKSNKKKKKE